MTLVVSSGARGRNLSACGKMLWGLRFEVDVNLDSPDGQTLAATVARRDVSGMSPPFYVETENWDDGGSGLPLRTITSARLKEISAVAWPPPIRRQPL
ncbi:phage head maturation protease [Bradyrhizobium sp. LM2.7]